MANLLFSKELQRKLDAEGIPIISMPIFPRAVPTANLQKTFMTLGPVLGRLAVMLSKLFFIEPSKGA
ncbi:hypothetical protein FRB97_000725 [Tulasnella sp. 331]|nr:hypothetical protein FRB97_000725 [Tulasnella sp. 331]